MRRLFVVVLMFTVVVATLASFSTLKTFEAEVASKAQVGIVYYPWHGALASDWQPPKFVDYPVSDLGNYSSLNKTVIWTQLVLMEELGVDFVVISWWGFYDDYGRFNDEAAKQVFETAQSINSNLTFAIMVEPYSTVLPYDYDGIYGHVYYNFVEPYPSLYFNYSGKPLVCFFNSESLTGSGVFPQDKQSRFTTVSVGQESYTDWIYTDLNKYDPPRHEPRRQISVTPRFDDSRFREPSCIVDPDLAEGVYDREWKKAIQLVRDGKIDIILISSWNEYVERTEIEPHHDGTANVPPDFLYNKTRDYIVKVDYEIDVQIHGEDYNDLTLSHLSDLGVTWVRMDCQIGMTEGIMTTLHDNGYKVLAVIDSRTAPFTTLKEWNRTLLSIVANPVSQLIDGWEVWNEPNALEEFGGAYIAPSDYREMLRCACGILKTSTKGLIISGGLAPHDNYWTYLNETFNDSDINKCYDYFGLHLYNDSSTVNLAYIDYCKAVTGKEVWITEIGRPSQTEAFTEDAQASFLVDNILKIARKVNEIFVYELYDTEGLSPPKENHFGLLTTKYEKKQSYFKLRELKLVEETLPEAWCEYLLVLIIIVVACAFAALLIQKHQKRQHLATLVPANHHTRIAEPHAFARPNGLPSATHRYFDADCS